MTTTSVLMFTTIAILLLGVAVCAGYMIGRLARLNDDLDREQRTLTRFADRDDDAINRHLRGRFYDPDHPDADDIEHATSMLPPGLHGMRGPGSF